MKNNRLMKKLLFVLFCFPTFLFAQTPIWEWATGWATNYNGLQDIAVNNFGESYVMGHYTSEQIIFNDTISGSGAYIAKFDTVGSFLWSYPVVITGQSTITGALDLDNNGNVIASFTGNSSQDTAKIIKLDANGYLIDEVAFAFSNGVPSMSINSLETDANNNIFIVFKQYLPTSGSGMVLRKYDQNLNLLWQKEAGASNNAPTNGNIFNFTLTTDYNNNVIVNGLFAGIASFDGNTITSTGGTNARNNFFVKYDENGNLIWLNSYASSGIPVTFQPDIYKIEVDTSGNIYGVGGVTATQFSFNGTNYNNSDPQIWLLKLDPNGQELWSHLAGDVGAVQSYEWGFDMSIRENNLFITGQLAGGGLSLQTVIFDTIQTNALGNLFVASYSLDGNVQFVKTQQLATLGSAYFFGIDSDQYGNLYLAGTSINHVYGALNLDGNIVSSNNVPGYTYELSLIAKLRTSGCTDPLALNYDPSAIMDDGSCCYNCGKIEGFIYEDADTSGTYDSIVETALGPQIIQLEKSSGEFSYLTSQTDGYYSFVVDTGQQVITYSPPAFWESSNNNTQYSINIQTNSTYSGLDFGIIPELTKGDMTIDLTSSNTVCNQTSTIWLTVRNEGTETITNVDLDLWVNNSYSILSASGSGTQNGNHIHWDLTGDFYPYLYTGEEHTFSVDIQTPPAGNSALIDSARVSPVQVNLIEIDMSNNFAQVSNTVLCSYDPNDKRVLPKKCFYNELDTLDFTIRFQNTGNYPATTVTLIDSLDLEKLDIMSFHVLGASHDYEWSLKVPSVLEVIFDNIMLVDSSVSFNESQGFFKYRIVVRDSLADLQPSATPAFIYFDLNAPVVTNLPEINFVSNLSASMQSTNSSCNGENDGTATLNIVSVTAPYTIAWNSGDTTSSLSNLAVGTYSVTLTDDKTCVYTDSVSITEPNAIVSSNSQSICDGQSITIGSNTYNTSGTYTDVFSVLNGCDSTVTTNLTVLANTSSNTTLNSCDPVSWNGQTYSNSGNYSFTTTNSNGCDSTATLDLTINSITSSSSAETSCDIYSWNGNTYNSSGTYSWVGTNALGCDSTANLDLTINSIYAITNTVSICFGDSVTVGGNTYNQTGTYNDTLTAANGCDSTITTNLTIYSHVVSIISQSGNYITVNTIGGTSPYIYQWNTGETTQTITPLADGDYWVIITDVNSCESDSVFFTVDWFHTSIAEININKLSIYPNPSNDVFNIVFGSNSKQDIDLRIHNVLGEVIFTETLTEFSGDYNRTVDMTPYPNAIYILQLSTQDETSTKKLVLEK